MRGRKPIPSERRKLEGYASHSHKRNDREPEPPLEVVTELPPSELEGHTIAQAEWMRVVPMLRKCRQVTDADRTALIALCLEWQRYLDATAEVKKRGMVVKAPSGYPITNPFMSIASRALAACSKLWPELGLTPSSRSRVVTQGPGPGGDAFSEFDSPPADVKH
jgi:P27 family predicted phage terminase small subunit